MTRQVRGLISARRLMVPWPPGVPRARPRGIRALGTRYEAAVARAIGPEALRGVWWEFRDANGPGLCQTDFLLSMPHQMRQAEDSPLEDDPPSLVVLECKHTWTPDGMAQLTGLYLPVVALATGRPTLGVQICKHLVPWAGPPHQTLVEAIAASLTTGLPSTLHWRIPGGFQSPEGRSPSPERRSPGLRPSQPGAF